MRDIPKGVCLLAYNAQFEKGVLRRLAELFADLSEHLMDIHDNMKDLMEPFAKRDFYDYRQNGSYSIKKIQPILAPSIDDGYKAMASRGEISNGGEAMNTFPAFATMSDEQIAKKAQRAFGILRTRYSSDGKGARRAKKACKIKLYSVVL